MVSNKPAGLWPNHRGQSHSNNSYCNRNNGGAYQRQRGNANQNSAAKYTASASTVQGGAHKNSGDTHSFVSKGQALSMGLKEYEYVKDNVVIPSGESVSCGRLYKEVYMVVGEVKLPVNVFKFPMRGFEVIVGMDWLGKYKASIDCHQKKVTLWGPKGTRVSYRGFVVKPKFKAIAAITLKSYMRKGCPMFICHIRDSRSEEPTATEIPVVDEFVDVFPDEIPGLPPKRDIDFNVELKPGTRPISMAPYRMAPKELEELKKRLDDLLEKGYI
ncbi:uncharacterized protein LOC141651618 [Silene latifolia]|uniref:uncharacterized protein LOC141651618 n=1 Tax=Silene latifolia TaxID=37657 RepID=UPI003D78ABE8